MPLSKRTLLMMTAGFIMIFTVMIVRSQLGAPPPVETASPSVARVVIARRDLVLGTFVQGEQDLDWGEAPATSAAPEVQNDQPVGNPDMQPIAQPTENWLHENAVKLSDFNGAVVRRGLRAGEAVPRSALMKSGEGGFMSAVLEPGHRAISVAVNATSGNAGFISPGDRVDLIVTHRVRVHGNDQNQNEEAVVSETFVSDVRVIAVDQQLDNPENKAILAKTVTVEVTPQQAEKVSVGVEMGKISMALRSLANSATKVIAGDAPKSAPEKNTVADLYDDPESRGMTRDSDVSQMLNRYGHVAPRVLVIRGDQSQTIEFYQDRK